MQDRPILSGPQFPTDPRGHGLDLPALTDISAPRSRPHSRFAAPFPPSNSIIQFLSSELRGSTSRCCVLGSGPEVLLSWKVLQPWLSSPHATSSGHCILSSLHWQRGSQPTTPCSSPIGLQEHFRAVKPARRVSLGSQGHRGIAEHTHSWAGVPLLPVLPGCHPAHPHPCWPPSPPVCTGMA